MRSVDTVELVDVVMEAGRLGAISLKEGAEPIGGGSRGVGVAATSLCWWKDGIVFVRITAVRSEYRRVERGLTAEKKEIKYEIVEKRAKYVEERIYALTKPSTSLALPYRHEERGIFYGRLIPEPEEGRMVEVWQQGSWSIEGAGELYTHIYRVVEDVADRSRKRRFELRSHKEKTEDIIMKCEALDADELSSVYGDGAAERLEEEKSDLREKLKEATQKEIPL